MRAPAVKELAQAEGLWVLQPRSANAPEALEAVRLLEPDALIVAAFGQLLRQPLLDIPKRGSLNVHASLLPKYRGAAPVAGALLAGEHETGATIMEVELALDSGPIVAQRALPIEANDTTGTLTAKVAELGAELLVDVLPAWERRKITPQPQDDSEGTYVRPVRREDAVIDWSLDAKDVWRRVRAYNPWPVSTTSVDGEPLRILEVWPLDEEGGVTPGTIVPLSNSIDLPGVGFAVQCGRGLLAVLRAQRSGKRAVSGADLLRGWHDLMGKQLGR